MFIWDDSLRRAQGHFLAALGFRPAECPYHVIASAPLWRLRDYGGADDGLPPLLIVSAPIKRPYLWDLTPRASAIRTCLTQGFHIFLLEWIPPHQGERGAGLEDYADRAIGECAEEIMRRSGSDQVLLMGHSLGGTFAAIFAAARPHLVRGFVLLSAPLCFARRASRFSDAVAERGPASLGGAALVPGSMLSEFCAYAAPEIFVWSRFNDAARCMADPGAMDIHLRVERWAFDEVALSGRLVDEILQWLYRENRLYLGTLPIGGRLIGPSKIACPLLAVVTAADDVACIESVAPFIAAIPAADARVVTYPGEAGACLQHLGILAGPEAYARIWPQITAWLAAHHRS